MGLLSDAAADVKAILEDTDGFGLTVTVTSPAGTAAQITGIPSDIGQTIDPETGQAVTGRQVHISLPVATLRSSFGELPRGVLDRSEDPWRVTVQLPLMAQPATYAVSTTMPDEVGCLVCFLEIYSD